ncbi:hypothetical protein NEOLEDRAFT_1139371 [Neolentinus lepideus HHB14362 ss-1]|uniref:Uncharacterized protein n=1 Tax=Neolentinus lepideus HHB14362 ss-1 TaxID=1314782 RepID=A0A165PU35_9AGAM|nr:hypothetical protein NEOLEDRAFT_1139360 [Neolentinus lepideus HHB14362 ss-1]KZT21500.1 hypothetical protein NEOLEDRAFT_1139371 [Neolentinus lepideus HHB14362 ss-1]
MECDTYSTQVAFGITSMEKRKNTEKSQYIDIFPNTHRTLLSFPLPTASRVDILLKWLLN